MGVKLDNHMSWPQIYSIWEHTNGNRYMPIVYSNIEEDRQDTYPTMITYRNVINNKIYTRRLIDWDRSMTFIAAARG